MNKNVLKIFLTEDLNSEQLDEALPKDLAVAYNNSGVDSKSRSKGYHTGWIDWENTDYTAITPEEGKELWKNDPTNLILIVTDSSGKDRVVKFREDGKVDIDPKFGSYRFTLPKENAYVKRDGTKVFDVFKAKINHLLSIAKKIYRTNEGEVTRNQAVRDLRATNPESPNYKDVTGAKRELINKYKNENAEALNLLSTLKDFQKYRKDPVDISKIGRVRYLDDTHEVVWDSSSYGGRGDANYWLEKFKDYFKRWSGSDGDTFVAWLCYLLALEGPNFTYRVPTEKEIRDWYNLKDVTSNFKADLRYLDVATILQEPKKALAQSLDKAHVLKNKIEYTQQDKDRFNSPEARSSREADITYYIQRYKERLMDAINNLEKYEAKLDDLDAEDARKIKEYDDEINNINNELTKALSSFNDMKANGAYTNSPFGRKVPESLQEEKSLDELVDILANRRTESLGELNEAFADEDKVAALAEYLDVDPAEISEIDLDYYDTPEGEYIVVDEDGAYQRAADEIKMTFDDMGLSAFTPQFQEYIVRNCISDSAIQEFIDEEIDYFETQEDDPERLEYLRSLDTREDKLGYIEETFGDLSDFVKEDNIDIDKVVEEAINQDGVAHFIAYYDGEENELGNGYYAYRVN